VFSGGANFAANVGSLGQTHPARGAIIRVIHGHDQGHGVVVLLLSDSKRGTWFRYMTSNTDESEFTLIPLVPGPVR
jgi:hypothetical protein